MGYKYELHTHNRIGSKCGAFTPEELVETFLGQGYTGICTTDHFFNGNTAAPGPEHEWKYRVEKFCEGYEKVKVEGDKRGLDVFFGFEYTVPHKGSDVNSNAGCDFLVFGIDMEWLINNGGDVATVSTNEYLNRCRAAGGTVIQAHPFRLAAGYMNHMCLFPQCVDGVEVLNGNPNTMGAPNKMAEHYADYYGFFKTAGTDIHSADKPLLAVTELPDRALDVFHMMRQLREGKQKLYFKKNELYLN